MTQQGPCRTEKLHLLSNAVPSDVSRCRAEDVGPPHADVHCVPWRPSTLRSATRGTPARAGSPDPIPILRTVLLRSAPNQSTDNQSTGTCHSTSVLRLSAGEPLVTSRYLTNNRTCWGLSAFRMTSRRYCDSNLPGPATPRVHVSPVVVDGTLKGCFYLLSCQGVGPGHLTKFEDDNDKTHLTRVRNRLVAAGAVRTETYDDVSIRLGSHSRSATSNCSTVIARTRQQPGFRCSEGS